MMRAKRPLLASVLATTMMVTSVMPLSASAEGVVGDRPGEIAMMGDALIARPGLLVSTVIGLGLFVVTLPFSLLGRNTPEAGQVLVLTPAKATFLRCLGCTPAQHERLRGEQELEKSRDVAESESTN